MTKSLFLLQEDLEICDKISVSAAGGPGLGYRGHGAGQAVPLDVRCCRSRRKDNIWLVI